jgi:hypothetical protein
MRGARHVALMGDIKNAYISVEKAEGKRNHSEDLAIDGKKILEWILGK